MDRRPPPINLRAKYAIPAPIRIRLNILHLLRAIQRYFVGWREAQVLAEGSVSYLYAPDHMRQLRRLWPDAKFIVTLRDPMQMLPSLHQRLLFQGDETVTDFGRAWRLSGERAQGRSIPRSCVDARQLRYDQVARFGHYLRAFWDAVGRENCLVVLHEDIAAVPGAVYSSVLAFAGLSPFDHVDTRAHRAGRGYRIGWLQRLLKRPPIVTRAVLAGEKFRKRVSTKPSRPPSRAARAVMATRKRLLRWNEAPAPATRVPPDIAREIADELRGDVAELSR